MIDPITLSPGLTDVLDMRFGASIYSHTSTPTLGVFHSVSVPPEATRRHLWMAADIFDSSAFLSVDPDWYLQAKVSFLLNGREITSLPIYTGSRLVPGIGVNIYAPKTGSGPQPALQAQAVDSVTNAFKKIDLPCFEFHVTCDRIDYEIVAVSLGAGSAKRDLCTGFIVLSMYP